MRYIHKENTFITENNYCNCHFVDIRLGKKHQSLQKCEQKRSLAIGSGITR